MNGHAKEARRLHVHVKTAYVGACGPALCGQGLTYWVQGAQACSAEYMCTVYVPVQDQKCTASYLLGDPLLPFLVPKKPDLVVMSGAADTMSWERTAHPP